MTQPNLAYLEAAGRILEQVAAMQGKTITSAAELIAESLMAGGVWHVFGTGHSHLVAEELYYRAGGLAPVNAILFPPLMQHEGPVTSTKLERTPGLAERILDQHDLRAGEVLTIVSNSGKNAVPVETALLARERGLKTIAITSVAQSKAAPYGRSMTHKLYEICDVVIDNCGSPGDAALLVPGTSLMTGPTSSLVNIAIVEQIVYEVACRFAERGVEPPLFKSANLPGGDDWNQRLIEQFRERCRLF
jgi:uncharacterized phosphosugar-binding protein